MVTGYARSGRARSLGSGVSTRWYRSEELTSRVGTSAWRARSAVSVVQVSHIQAGADEPSSWLAHRVTGVAIILFLFAHVVDTALVGWGPNAYNRVVRVYQNPIVGLLELGLVAAVLYHALNGVRIMITDFWPKAADFNRQLIYGPPGHF